MKNTKHYGAGYLTDTGEFLKQLKIHSYSPFASIQKGVVVDLGCGTGMDATNLADMLGPNVHIIGIDHDATMIEQAELGKGQRTNLTFEKGEVYKLGFHDNSLSGVRMERVIQHLLEPEIMFDEVYRTLAVGRPLVIVETIWNSLNFYTKHVDIEDKIRRYLTESKVNNGWAGNKLASDLSAKGFSEISLEIHNMVVRSKEEANKYLFLDRILSEMVEKTVLTEGEATKFQESLTKADLAGYFLSSMTLVIASAIRQ